MKPGARAEEAHRIATSAFRGIAVACVERGVGETSSFLRRHVGAGPQDDLDGVEFAALPAVGVRRRCRPAQVGRTEARLTYTGLQGDVSTGLAGSWAAGAVLVTDDGPARFERIAVGRTAIFTGGRAIRLPDHRDGWRWEPHAVEGADPAADGRLTVLDGPLYGIRRRRSLPFIGYVKTHHRRLLALDLWLRVPGLSVGERSGLFVLPDDLYGCYLRVGDPGPWAEPWAGIARIEVPAGIGLAAAVGAVDDTAGWLPAFASALHRDARAPVNLTPRRPAGAAGGA